MRVTLGRMPVASQSSESDRVITAPVGRLVVPPAQPAAGAPTLSLVVPTLNERENIADFLSAVRTNLDAALPGDYEVIVVDDDSPDRTWEIAAGLVPGFP